MSVNIVGVEPEKVEAFNWHHEDIVNQPPLSHSDMVDALAHGNFIIEGKVSTFEDAVNYCDHFAEVKECWDALRGLEQIPL